MIGLLENVNKFVWGVPALLAILGVGIYLTVCSRFAQFTCFGRAMRLFVRRLTAKGESQCEGVSSYQALCTALAATVGTGNLVGVAGAIAIGGPGAIFWMWVCGVLGMMIKFAEAALAVRYRQRNEKGEWVGGPMYMIKNGIGNRYAWLGYLYCFFAVVAAFGVGNATQINSVVGGIHSAVGAFGVDTSKIADLAIGIFLAILLTYMLLGGAKRIGQVAERLIPFASAFYILLCIGVLLMRFELLPTAFSDIVTGAFAPHAVTGGAVGSAFVALRVGASRGVFTNEAGMGTASIAHSCAHVFHPVEQGYMGIIEVFLDTIVICTLTAFVILCSGVSIPFGLDEGVTLTTNAFSSVYGSWVCVPIALFLCCFAFATVLGWGLYGARCAEYLFGEKAWKPFVFLQAIVIIVSTVLKTETVWMMAETVNGLMAVPNLLALAVLSPELFRLIQEYRKSAV